MSDLEQALQFPADFDGRVRLFPLPNLVLFPCVAQPLRIFEPRYIAMLQESLATDRLIALATLESAQDTHLPQPPVHQQLCLGRVITHAQDARGHYNIFLVGLQRAVIVDELPLTKSFREADVRVISDQYPAGGDASRLWMQAALFQRLKKLLPAIEEITETAPLGMLTDVLAHALQLPLEQKLKLLSEGNVDRRAEELLISLDEPRAGNRGKFPPDFSLN